MPNRNEITQEILKKYLYYNLNTGVFTWLARTQTDFNDGDHSADHNLKKWNAKHAGKTAGSFRKSDNRQTDYFRIRIQGHSYYSHRLAWLYSHGEYPDQIDHVNGDGTDNRLENLRSVSHKTNHRNMPKQKNNKSGLPGVRWSNADRCWIAQIKVNNKAISLGRSRDFFIACCVRKSAENKFEFHSNHGRG